MEVKSSGQFRMVCPQACFAYDVVRNNMKIHSKLFLSTGRPGNALKVVPG